MKARCIGSNSRATEHAAPTELGRPILNLISIHMALLTELVAMGPVGAFDCTSSG